MVEAWRSLKARNKIAECVVAFVTHHPSEQTTALVPQLVIAANVNSLGMSRATDHEGRH